MTKECKISVIPKSTGKNTYLETLKTGKTVVRIKKGLSPEESTKEFEKAVKQGKTVCLSDLMINYGM
jgi:hypothetical protein